MFSEAPKQAAHGWGGKSGGDEWADEAAGEAIAKADERDGNKTPGYEGENEGEPISDEVIPEEENHKSYDDYLAELARTGGSEVASRALSIVGPRNKIDKLVKRLDLLR